MLATTENATLAHTTCPYCGVGCGVDVSLRKQQSAAPKVQGVTGTPEHPANYGRLCIKGSQLASTLSTDGRLVRPSVDGDACSWDEASSAVAERFSSIIKAHGPEAVAFYVSGQLLTEDYYVANKLMKGYIGSANIDTNSRLCMSSAVAAHKRAFGSDAVPSNYEDLELADLIVFIGSNAAWTHPVLFQRIERAKKSNPNLKLVFVDPRKTASSEQADLHLPIKAGTDVALFNGLLNYLACNEGLDQSYIDNSVAGAEEALEKAAQWSVNDVARVCDVDVAKIEAFYALFLATDKVVSVFSMGVNQSSAGVDKANSIINCHLVSGRIGKPGSAPFSITGQPNAMGGREVGGLANMLAAHMDIENPEHRQTVQTYWESPTIAATPGLKAVELFDAIKQGKVKAVWIMATNPVVSMPNRSEIEHALAQCECVVVSDFVDSNDTLAFADIKLPASSWSEKDGTVTNSERRISRQRGFLPTLGESRHDWQMICDVAKKMGFTGFDFASPREIFVEYAGLTGYKNNGARDLDLSGLASLTEQQYNALKPVQWPVNSRAPQGTPRLFSDGVFYTQTGKANCIAIDYQAPKSTLSSDYPYVLNTGRLRDQWHTMTRTGVSAKLTQHKDRAYLSMHPKDAAGLGVEEGAYVSVTSEASSSPHDVILPVELDDGLRQGELFAPIHWGKAWASASSVSYLFGDARDPISGQPELKYAAVCVTPVKVVQQGYILSRQALPEEALSGHVDIWSKTKIRGAFLYQIASKNLDQDLFKALQSLVSCDVSVTHQTQAGASYVALEGDVLAGMLVLGSASPVIERAWLEDLVSETALSAQQIHQLLHGEIDPEYVQGKTVCSCFKIGEKAVNDAIQQHGCNSVEKLGRKLQCGTNCGSCKPELQKLINQNNTQALDVSNLEEVL